MTASAAKRLKGLARRCGKCVSIPKAKEANGAQNLHSVWTFEHTADDRSTKIEVKVNTDFIVIDPHL